jgi:hypothetical protein
MNGRNLSEPNLSRQLKLQFRDPSPYLAVTLRPEIQAFVNRAQQIVWDIFYSFWHLTDIRNRFGDRVADIVHACCKNG